MNYIYNQRKIRVEWSIYKGSSGDLEDFSRAYMKVFIIGPNSRYAVEASVSDMSPNVTIDMPQGLPEGVYLLEAIWGKNWMLDDEKFNPTKRPLHSRDLSHAKTPAIFALTSDPAEENIYSSTGTAVVKVRSNVSTYGYDGLDAYQIAVFRGRFSGSEQEWLDSLGDRELINYYTKGEVDELIDNVHVDLSDYYTKGEVDDIVDSVEVDLSGYYTKEQTDTKISEAAAGLRDEVEENTDAINDVSQRVSTNTQGIADNAGNIAANTDAITENTNDINQLKSGMTTMGGRVDELETELDNIVGLDQSNYKGMFSDVNSLPSMTSAGWAWVGSDMTAMAVYVWYDSTTGWVRFGSQTYNMTDYSSVVTQVATIGLNLGDLEKDVAFIEDDNALLGSVVRTDSSGSRKEEKFDIIAGVAYTVTSSSSSSELAYFKFYDANDTQIGENHSVSPGNSWTGVAPDNAVSLGIISYRAINVDITTPGKIRLLKEEISQKIDKGFADLQFIDDTLIALTTDGLLASSSQEMKATGGWTNTQVFIKEGTSLIVDKGGDAEISYLSVALRDKSGQNVFYRNIGVNALPYTINTTADVYFIRWGCAAASYVITPGTLTLSVTTKECISSIRKDITSIGQDLETVNNEIEGVKDEIEEIKKVPFTINGLQSFEQVFARNAKAESIQTIDCPLYGLDERIINPDNLRTRDRGIAEIPGSIFRVNCNLYKRWGWYKLQDEQGNIDFTPIRNEILNCAENHTRLHTRVFYWSGSVYDKNNLKYPTDYSEHQDLYDTYFTDSGITFQDGIAYIGSKPIILGYPSFVFWDMVKEGTLPYLDEDSSAYTGVPNYDSETLYTTWYNCLSAFSQFIEQTINVSYLQSPLKIKNCIELLQGGSVGIYGEGFIRNYGGHFPSTTEKLTRYFTAYITLFPDVRLSFPLGMYYDSPFYGYPTIEQILNSSNTMGKVALFNDVIGQGTGSFKLPDYNPISKSFRDVLDSDNRQIEGETAGAAIGVGAPTLLTDIYIFHLSGATLDNYGPYAPLGYSQKEKAQTLIGSKFALVRSGYNASTGKIQLDLQNLGVSKIFSPYWKITYVFRDINGEKISSVDSNISIQDIAPNSNMYDEVGLVVSQDMTEESVTIPANTKRIYLAIVDKYGIYPNYFLLNKNRTENGEYIIATL